MTSISNDFSEKIRRAYIEDLEQQMSLGLTAQDQRECAAFLDEVAQGFEDHVSTMCCELVNELGKKKPQGIWYRRWLDGNAHLFTWPNRHATGSRLKEELPRNADSDPNGGIGNNVAIHSVLRESIEKS